MSYFSTFGRKPRLWNRPWTVDELLIALPTVLAIIFIIKSAGLMLLAYENELFAEIGQ